MQYPSHWPLISSEIQLIYPTNCHLLGDQILQSLRELTLLFSKALDVTWGLRDQKP